MPTSSEVLAPHLRTTADLIDLGSVSPAWTGILSPAYDRTLVESFIHAQFLDRADDYIGKYQHTPHWAKLLTDAEPYLQLASEKNLRILDIGSGAGNTVFPLLDRFEDAVVVASDLSIPLLRALIEHLRQNYPNRECYVMQLNAEQLIFEDGQFDLVVGGSILHHLFAPEKCLGEVARVLKPGASAVFFEPFESGNQILALVMKHLTAMNGSAPRSQRIPRDVIEFFGRMCLDYEVRKGTDKSADLYRHLDDKWLFTQSYLNGVAGSCGFAGVTTSSINDPTGMFTRQIQTLLRLGLGVTTSVMPGWALEYLGEVDVHFSEDARRDLMFEGAVIFHK